MEPGGDSCHHFVSSIRSCTVTQLNFAFLLKTFTCVTTHWRPHLALLPDEIFHCGANACVATQQLLKSGSTIHYRIVFLWMSLDYFAFWCCHVDKFSNVLLRDLVLLLRMNIYLSMIFPYLPYMIWGNISQCFLNSSFLKYTIKKLFIADTLQHLVPLNCSPRTCCMSQLEC